MAVQSDGRAVHSIVCACFVADPGGDSRRAVTRLNGLVTQAIERSGAAAERLADVEIGIAAIFLNSTAALDYAQCLLAGAVGPEGMPVKVGVHMGPLDAGDEHLAQRAPVRLARQIATLAVVGRALVSPLFHNFVTHFDHACKGLIHPAARIVDPQGREIQVYEARFERALPKAGRRERQAAGAAAPQPVAVANSGFLPADPARRDAFLARAEKLLAEEIGPLARLIVRKAETGARSRTAFYQQLVDAVPDTGRREALLKALGGYD